MVCTVLQGMVSAIYAGLGASWDLQEIRPKGRQEPEVRGQLLEGKPPRKSQEEPECEK